MKRRARRGDVAEGVGELGGVQSPPDNGDPGAPRLALGVVDAELVPGLPCGHAARAGDVFLTRRFRRPRGFETWAHNAAASQPGIFAARRNLCLSKLFIAALL